MTYRAQHTENKATEKQAIRETGSPTTSSSSTTTDTQPGVFLAPWEYEQIRQGYESLLGRLNIHKAHDIEIAINRRVEVSAILDALEQTALAPRPSHAYFRAILTRYAEHGILTREDAEAERQERRRERYLAKRQQYSAWYDAPLDECRDQLFF